MSDAPPSRPSSPTPSSPTPSSPTPSSPTPSGAPRPSRSAFDEFASSAPPSAAPAEPSVPVDPETLPGVADYDEGEEEAPIQLSGGSPTRHYEAAFEHYLRSVGIPYLVADQGHRAVFAGLNVKCFDFLIAGVGGVSWIVDVKGRRVPLRPDGKLGGLQTWVTQDDVDSLSRWQERFGSGHAALFVFAYWLPRRPEAAEATLAPGPIHEYEGGLYRFCGIRLSDYKSALRVRSPRWKTVHVPAKFFRDYSRPFRELV